MLRNRPFRLFVFHILLAVPFVILSALACVQPGNVCVMVAFEGSGTAVHRLVGVCVNNKTHECQNLCKCFEMAAVADPS